MTPAGHEKPPVSVAGEDWFRSPELRAVFDALNRDGHEARIVGGALRNTLMGLPIVDADFAVTAEPDEVMRLARAAGLKTAPTGIAHGTVTIISGGRPFEATTLRRDVETDGRYAKVAFTRDWAADAARRDFTINALYAGADGQVYDPLGQGVADISRRWVRFIGRAIDRIREDYLRILRFFRFTADYSATPPDPDGLAACIEGRSGLAKLSAERIRTELFRLLTARQPMLALEPMADAGILGQVVGGVTRTAVFQRFAGIEAGFGLPPDPVRRLAALAVIVREDAERLSARLRLSGAEAGRLKAIAEPEPALHMSEREARVLLYRLGSDAYTGQVMLAWSRQGGDEEGWRALYGLPAHWTPPEFPVTGKDLLARGFYAGPELGEALRALEDRWLASDFTLSRDDLLKALPGKLA